MAWSDAARAAAAVARKAHARTRTNFKSFAKHGGHIPMGGNVAYGVAAKLRAGSHRKALASSIRHMRKHGGHDVQGTMIAAVRSTALRNHFKKFGR